MAISTDLIWQDKLPRIGKKIATTKYETDGSTYYKGGKLSIGATTGDKTLDVIVTSATKVVGITITPDTAGASDPISVAVYDTTPTLVETIAESIYNLGANISIGLDFPKEVDVPASYKLRTIYNNASGTAKVLNVIVEYLK